MYLPRYSRIYFSSEHSMPSANLVSTERISARYSEDPHTEHPDM